MNSLLGTTLVHLGPGTFETNGYADDVLGGWQTRQAMRIVGSGMNATTLKLVNTTSSGKQYFAIGHALTTGNPAAPNPMHFCEVSDLTIDCNLPSGSSVACGAIRLMGNHVKVHRVRAINWGTTSSTKPCFVIAVLTADRSSAGTFEAVNAGIDRCAADSPSSNGPSAAITVLHVGGKENAAENAEAYGRACYIRNCFVDCGSLANPLTPDIRALSMGWCHAGIVEGNQVHNVKIGGPYQDKATSREIVVRNNSYRNVVRGPYWKLGTSAAPAARNLSQLTNEQSVAVATLTDHGFKEQDRIKIDAGGGASEYKGVFLVKEVPSANQVKYQMQAIPQTAPGSTPTCRKVFGVANILVERNIFVSVFVAGLLLLAQHASGATVTRGPFVQMVTTNGITIRWRSDVTTDSMVRFGTNAGHLDQATNNTSLATNHELRLDGLAPATRYYYSVGSSAETLASGSGFWFATAPVGSQPTRIWAIGDSGEPGGASITYQSYTNFTAARPTDVWLMLGDNDYSRQSGPAAYQAAVFDTFPELLRQAVLWPTIGNDESGSDYVATFTLPMRGEAGGMASGTELYYSFDYGDIHFVALDSNNGAQTNDPMVLWLEQDLAANTKTWTIAYWHHPPYSHGPHNSDLASKFQQVQMREVVLPVLESHGVDLVLTGHSHVYERSFLIDGHYGYSTNLQASMIVDSGNGRENQDGPYEKAGRGPAPHQGALYAVVGCSSRPLPIGSLDHPVMVTSFVELGSLVLDVVGGRMDGKFVNASGVVRDYFTLLKHRPPTLSIERTNSQVSISWPRDPAGFELEQNSVLPGAPASWTTVPPPYLTNGSRIDVTLPLTTSNSFYRLRK